MRGIRNGSPEVPEITRDGMVLRFRPERSLVDAVRQGLTINVAEQQEPKGPRLSAVRNIERPDTPMVGVPGEIIHIVGARLAFGQEDETEGVFFVAEDGTEFRAVVYSRHGTSLIDCKIPDMPSGDYTLAVRGRPHEGAKLRTGIYAATFTIS